MFGGWRNKSIGPIGLDLGAFSVKLLQLRREPAGWSALAAAARPIPPGTPADGPQRTQTLTALIKDMLANGGFAGHNVVSSLPATGVQYKNLRLPKMLPEELAAAVEWEAADRLRLSPEAMRFEFFDAGEVRQGDETREEIILLAAARTAIDEHVELLSACGLQPVAIDAVPGALARCLGREQADLDAPSQVIVDVGYSSSKVLVVRGGRVAFFKLIEIGGERFDQTVAQHLNLPLADAAELRRHLQRPSEATPEGDAACGPALPGGASKEGVERAVFEALRGIAGELAKELSLCLRYYSVTFRGRRPESLQLVGGEAYEPHLARLLAEGVGTGIEAAQPLAGVDLARVPALAGAGRPLSEWAVAAGLSMRRPSGAQKRSAA